MDLLLNFVVLILGSLLNIHWWIFVVLCFVVARLTGHLKVHPEDGISFSNSASVFGATLIAVFLYEWFVEGNVFGLQSLIAIFIMVAAVRSVTQAIIREKANTANGDKGVRTVTSEQRQSPTQPSGIGQDSSGDRTASFPVPLIPDKHVGEITSGELITGTVPINSPKAGFFWDFSPSYGGAGSRGFFDPDPDVKIGDSVLAGDILCFIDDGSAFGDTVSVDFVAVEAERAGIVRQIFKSHEDPVEVGETLFSIEVDLTDEREKLYEEVWRELEQGNKDMGLWARLLAKHDGNEEKTTADYLRTRVERLGSKN